MAAQLDRLLHFFPIQPSDAPGADLQRDVACHCALGTMYPALAAAGIDVARALPWVKPWFVRYQMADGGLNCDETAYLQTAECPSSMVATVAPLEAMLLDTEWTREERALVDRAAGFLIERALVRGSDTVHNADERRAAAAWPSHFLIGVPVARPINPVTKKDWEGTGVAPDVAVPADRALDVALKLAAEQIAKAHTREP
jgi:hypothetical protein